VLAYTLGVENVADGVADGVAGGDAVGAGAVEEVGGGAVADDAQAARTQELTPMTPRRSRPRKVTSSP
jgi:hypothetical protein